jgi:hypothetical protein
MYDSRIFHSLRRDATAFTHPPFGGPIEKKRYTLLAREAADSKEQR